ncbi:MAG: type site-specific deoxyribonuclease, HsdR family [Chthonomonadaceae bacterium]|nr:type site-specific deoxyribonuclease, HsdR family [Chthonomonadaceae bacterium]
MTTFTESIVEEATLCWFEELGYDVLHGPDIAPGEPGAERVMYADVVLVGRLRAALGRLNPHLPADALDEVCRKLTRPDHPALLENNRRFHRLLVDGVPVSYQGDGRTVHDLARVVDFDNVGANEFLAINQFTIIENGQNRRPDVIVFVNGLPLAVIELKNAADANATVKHAFNQLQTYKQKIPSLFPFNELFVISDGLQAKVGTLTSDWERFQPWRTVDGTEPPAHMTPLEVLIRGMFAKERLLDLLQNFIVFEVDGPDVQKKVAAYHQYHAVNKAVACTVRASSPTGDRRIGVVWHTQGSGKSLSMVFYAGKLVRQKEMQNPTLVVLTDRNDLDDQLFGTFSRCQDLVRQAPEQVDNRASLRTQLHRASGGIVFTTLQKFTPEDKGDAYPLLSDRRNIVVIADESHRSQYGFDAKVVKKGEDEAHIKYGYAKYLRDAIPNASFIGFTGTPIERADANTRAVFGDYIDIYDISRSVEDGATVRIYYEGRLAKLELAPDERPHIDPDFEEVTEGEEISVKEKLKRKWAQMEAMIGTPKRITLIARDIVDHFEARQSAMQGKAMIVGMSRRICADLYKEIIALRPDWHSTDDSQGSLKVVMTGTSSDELNLQPHIRNKAGREAIAKRFKDPDDSLQLVIVRDMWLTGFDVPCLHTMYVDKPMKGSGLMQAIARVNRVFRDKPGGLIVDYLGIADQLKQALAEYTAGDRNQAGVPQEVAVAKLVELMEVTDALLHEFDAAKFWTGTPAERLTVLLGAQNHVLTLDDGKKRYVQTVTELGRAFALAVPHEKALELRERVGFYQAVKAGLIKTTGEGETSAEDLHTAVRQIVSKAVTSNEVIDIFGAAGLDKPEISILSDEFLAEVQGLEYKNLALEALRKLLADQIRAHARTNLVQSRQFSLMLEESIRRLQNRSLETAQVIAELVELAKQMREANNRGEKLGLTDDELAFYDALEVNDSAVKILGDDTLRTIARELVKSVQGNVTIDWNVKESARARLRLMVKRVLRKFGYPPDKQEQATNTVLEQTELLCTKWT